MKKYNPQIKQFEAYEVSEDWNVQIVPDDKDASCNCASCGAEISSWRNSYMSHFIQPDDGDYKSEPSYAICKDCMDKELETEKLYIVSF